jgi:hypothetical protein
MSRRWTKARVLKVYADWQALEKHAGNVAEDYSRIFGEAADFYKLLPHEFAEWELEKAEDEDSTWHPKFEWETWEGGDYPGSLPLRYLWTDGWRERRKREHEEWLATRDATEVARKERAEFERLKAKFEVPA